ncbi:MarR family transcriptional regulator [Microbacterium sp. B35-30]|uniref:MarR family winged helix-turn-helix transcriptional regulator n=1 Tax=Microbacterium sp. B35-30 TaxID=1962642 RepID=UPI001953D4F8|nr:MarR family transcriptional regulator [Microbacterium sp. B35-30]KAF2420809.1 MarR family transcriptional regulator [Microbacterium sp. B35-30]
MEIASRVAEKPTWLVNRLSARAHALLAESFAAAGVRGYHYRLLAAMEQAGPVSQADLGRLAGLDRSDVVATLDDLAHWGLARREPDPTDRRRNAVIVTDAGVERLAELESMVEAVQVELLAPLTTHEARTFVQLLTKLLA